MKVNYIQESIFKNPEEMKASAERRNNLSNADRLANNAQRVIEEEVEKFFNVYLNTNSISDNQAQRNTFLNSFAIGCGGLTSLFRVDFSTMKDSNELTAYPVSKYTSKVKIEGNDIKIHIYVETLWHDWIDFVKHNQKMRAMKQYPSKIRMRVTDGSSYIHSTGLLTSWDIDPKKDFSRKLKYLIEEESRVIQCAAKQVENEQLVDFIYNKNIILEKVHLFGDIDGDLVFYCSTFDDYDDRHLIVENMKFLLNTIQFDNSGKIVIIDRGIQSKSLIDNTNGISSIMPIVIKNNKVFVASSTKSLVEGYFNNPEQARKKIENRNNVSKAEVLANTSSGLVVQELERLVNSFLVRDYDKEFKKYSERFVMADDVFGSYIGALLEYSYDDISSDIAKSNGKLFTTTAKISNIREVYDPNYSHDRNEVEVEIYININCPGWYKHLKERQESDKISPILHYNIYTSHTVSNYDLQSNIRQVPLGFNRIKETFSRHFETNFIAYVYKNKDKFNNLVSLDFINNTKFIIKKVHLFSDVQGDIVIRTNMCDGWGEFIEDVSKDVEFKFNKLCNVVSFDNTGDIIIRDDYRRVKDIVLTK